MDKKADSRYARKYREKHPERAVLKDRRKQLRSHGLSVEQYEQMMVAQNGVCAICRRPERTPRKRGVSGVLRALSVDHDHETDEVRGLLCHNCNLMLGYGDDDPARLRAGADYLEKAASK
jgi:hypothetical protein